MAEKRNNGDGLTSYKRAKKQSRRNQGPYKSSFQHQAGRRSQKRNKEKEKKAMNKGTKYDQKLKNKEKI